MPKKNTKKFPNNFCGIRLVGGSKQKNNKHIKIWVKSLK